MTGRALQAENDDLEKCWSCASVSGLLMERSAPGHHGYPHALDLIRVSAPKGHMGHLITNALARPFLHLLFPTRRPRWESRLLLSGSA
jgi:hypothetical protein